MRTTIIVISALLFTPLFGSEASQNQQNTEESIENIDYEITLVDQQIEHYTGLAKQFERQSEDLLSHDFMGSRHAEELGELNRSLANDLIQRRQELQKQREELLKATPTPRTAEHS